MMMHEELKAEKLEECKRDMYEDMLHERLMKEDMSYLMDYYADEIDTAYGILQAISKDLWEKYQIEMSPVDLLKEM